MRPWFLVFPFLTSALISAAQSDTTITYLDGYDKPCTADKALRYTLQHKENNHWKKVVFDAADDKPIYGAYYSDSACTLFDGPYSAFNKDLKLTSKGYYANNKKTGLWKGYADSGELIDSAFYVDGFIYGIAIRKSADGTILDSLIFEKDGKGTGKGYWPNRKPREAGNFLSGKKIGLWTYYYKTGMKCQEVNYVADSAVSYTCYDEYGKVQDKNCYFEKEAAFKGGDRGWIKYLQGKLSSAELPKAYYDGKIYGTVYIQFVVDINGDIINVKAVSPIAPELERIAISIIQQSPAWEPAVQYNRKVKAYRKQPITFPKAE